MSRYNPDYAIEEAAEARAEAEMYKQGYAASEASRWKALKYLNELIYSLENQGHLLNKNLERAKALLLEEKVYWASADRDPEVDDALRKIELT